MRAPQLDPVDARLADVAELLGLNPRRDDIDRDREIEATTQAAEDRIYDLERDVQGEWI